MQHEKQSDGGTLRVCFSTDPHRLRLCIKLDTGMAVHVQIPVEGPPPACAQRACVLYPLKQMADGTSKLWERQHAAHTVSGAGRRMQTRG